MSIYSAYWKFSSPVGTLSTRQCLVSMSAPRCTVASAENTYCHCFASLVACVVTTLIYRPWPNLDVDDIGNLKDRG